MNIIYIMKNVQHNENNFRFVINYKITIGKQIKSYVRMKNTASFIFVAITDDTWIKIIQYSETTRAERLRYGMSIISENITDETVLKILNNIPPVIK